MTYTFARVHILDLPFTADRPYEYYIPQDLAEDVRVGCFVTVPFGINNRQRNGIVYEIFEDAAKSVDTSKPIPDGARKPIGNVFPRGCDISPELLKAAVYLKETTLCSIGDAIRSMIPAALLEYADLFYTVRDESYVHGSGAQKLTFEQLGVFGYIKRNNGAFLDELKQKFGKSVEQDLEFLTSKNCVRPNIEIGSGADKTVKHIRLTMTEEQIEALESGTLGLRSEYHRQILNCLRSGGGYMPLSELYSKNPKFSSSQITSLEKKGYIGTELISVRRDPFDGINITEPKQYVLSEEQQGAYDTLESLYACDEPRAALLLGVTGSGKTAVMIKLIDRALNDGKGVIALLPEIALTPQMMSIFCSYYGKRVAVMHSGLSAGERLDTYRYIKEGHADIVIGTRSAIFAPVKSLGIIIIDEEQEHTYKSDVTPKYHARDVARFRCAANNALMLLMSATPSLESYSKALDGKYTLVRLKGRFGKARLPEVTVADMRNEVAEGNTSPLGHELVNTLLEVKSRGEQAILFINRRGYHNFISCKTCGEAIKCPSCSVSMTHHKFNRTYSDSTRSGYLFCHWCGKRMELPRVCPSCGSEHLAYNGYGTQHVEEDLIRLIPDLKILRMDTDSTGSKKAYDDILGKFRESGADVLLGTQMVTKGHDFPNVTAVGVLLADMSLYVDDFRASERTFSMLTQVVGRAGRAQKSGRAIIQTNNPDHDVIRLSCAQDYETFAANELRIRRSLVFPPYCDIALLSVSGAIEKDVARTVSEIHNELVRMQAEEYSDVRLIVFGPFEAPVYKVDKKYRMRLVVKCRLNKRSRALFAELLGKFYKNSYNHPYFSIDFNPSSL